jgi:hypothetical protein
MIEMLLLTEKVLIAEMSWGLAPVGAKRGRKALTEVLLVLLPFFCHQP